MNINDLVSSSSQSVISTMSASAAGEERLLHDSKHLESKIFSSGSKLFEISGMYGMSFFLYFSKIKIKNKNKMK